MSRVEIIKVIDSSIGVSLCDFCNSYYESDCGCKQKCLLNKSEFKDVVNNKSLSCNNFIEA